MKHISNLTDTTERKLAEDSLREIEVRYRSIFDHVPYGIVIIDPNTATPIDFNNQACTQLGYTREEFGKLKISDIDLLEDHEKVKAHIQRIIDTGQDEFETVHRTKSGEKRNIHVKAQYISIRGQSVYHCIWRDITESKRAAETLRESEGKFRLLTRQFHALLDAIPDNITRQAPDLRVIWANRGAAAGLKKEATDLAGNYCYSLWHKRTSPCEACPVLKTFRTGEPALEIVTTPDGKTWELRSVPVKEAGRVVEVVEIGRDITEHKKLEEQLRQAQKMEAVGTLAGGIAHDFNNALTGVVGFGELLRMRVAGDEQALHDLDNILGCAERAATLTRQLLAFARRQVMEPVNLSLNTLVVDLMKLIGKVLGEYVEVKTSLEKNLPTIHADRGQIEQVLMNLCLNARDAMPEGGQLLVETEEVHLDEEYVKYIAYIKVGRYVLLKVSDTGIGMDEKTREQVFEPFFTTKGPDKGTGLGLAMVYGIVKQHDGYIHCYSEPGKGTTFKVYFPAVKAQPDAVPTIRREETVRGGMETILLAEDEEAIRLFIERTLKGLGYKVLVASNGEEAIEIYRKNKEIALAILDVVMPRKGGKEAFEEMRKQNPRLKGIFMSGYGADAIHDSFVLIPGMPFLQKPFGPTILARKIREVLDTQ